MCISKNGLRKLKLLYQNRQLLFELPNVDTLFPLIGHARIAKSLPSDSSNKNNPSYSCGEAVLARFPAYSIVTVYCSRRGELRTRT